MKYIYNCIVLIVLSVLLLSSACEQKSDKTTIKKPQERLEKSEKANNLNISFLLDLSDRINPQKYPNPSMDYYKRDAAYIKSVAEAFEGHLRTKRVRTMNDKIQLFFDPEPLNQEINALSNNLKFEVTKDNASTQLLEKVLDAYSTKPIEVYSLAIKDDKYIGSDTWKFFKNKAIDYCIEDGFRNVLVVLTDGYIYHNNTKIREGNLTTYLTPQDIRSFKLTSSNWKIRLEKEKFGFIPATDDLSNLEVLVLGINPDQKNPFEEDIIMTYWSNWLNAMKVKRFELKNADLPSNMDKLIKDFILDK
ncbi:hypothetical protein [Aquimarina mytili]|uniref:Lipoprotein n=1 Tax=Aquimarina mytili TaxID=874423 RepID=A0A936ZQF9_9FLAO|nr:hypothetical protein [Aquimarina mytili]MBL0682818.1 hypothetical protein [Aquimarina mytili]